MFLLGGAAMLLRTNIGREIEKEIKDTFAILLPPDKSFAVVCGHAVLAQFTEGFKTTTKFIKEDLPLPKARIFPWLRIQQK